MSFFNTMGAFGPDVISSAFSNASPTGRVTNPKAKKLGKGKTAKSKKRRMREAQMQMQQPQMSFADQRQLQNDQFKFLQDNIFGRTGATRRTIGGQLERDVPQGMDFFKNTGPDRQSVKDRQARLDSTSLNQPGVWNQAQQAVNDAKRAQGWSDPNTPPAPPPGPSMDQILRQNTNTVDVFNNPANDHTNPRTGLTTNNGAFVRSRPNPYGSASALFTPQTQGAASQAQSQQASVNPGPISNLFQGGFQNYNQAVNDALQKTAPQNTVPYRPVNDAQAVFTPQTGLTPPSPINEAPSMANPAAAFGVPSVSWGDIIPQENSPPMFDLFKTNPQTGAENFDWTKLLNIFTPQPQEADAKRPFYPQGF